MNTDFVIYTSSLFMLLFGYISASIVNRRRTIKLAKRLKRERDDWFLDGFTKGWNAALESSERTARLKKTLYTNDSKI